MTCFWEGFEKRALSKDGLKEWLSESFKKMKDSQPKNLDISPIVASQSFTPDTYWRSWP